MQMSAALWRNAVCGPGCGEIVILDNGDTHHASCAEAGGPSSSGAGSPPMSDRLVAVCSVAADSSFLAAIAVCLTKGCARLEELPRPPFQAKYFSCAFCSTSVNSGSRALSGSTRVTFERAE